MSRSTTIEVQISSTLSKRHCCSSSPSRLLLHLAIGVGPAHREGGRGKGRSAQLHLPPQCSFRLSTDSPQTMRCLQSLSFLPCPLPWPALTCRLPTQPPAKYDPAAPAPTIPAWDLTSPGSPGSPHHRSPRPAHLVHFPVHCRGPPPAHPGPPCSRPPRNSCPVPPASQSFLARRPSHFALCSGFSLSASPPPEERTGFRPITFLCKKPHKLRFFSTHTPSHNTGLGRPSSHSLNKNPTQTQRATPHLSGQKTAPITIRRHLRSTTPFVNITSPGSLGSLFLSLLH